MVGSEALERMAAESLSHLGRVRKDENCRWDQMRLAGRKNGGKEVGVREVRGVGTEMKSGWMRVGSNDVSVRSLCSGGRLVRRN